MSDVNERGQVVRAWRDFQQMYGLTEEQITELFDAVQRMKSKSSNQNFVKHGWQCLYVLRSSGSATRGDMCVIDPRDGQKIFSLVGMRRKLGLEEAMVRHMSAS